MVEEIWCQAKVLEYLDLAHLEKMLTHIKLHYLKQNLIMVRHAGYVLSP